MERAEALVAAEDLGVRTRRGWIFSGVTLWAEPGAVVVVAGPGGSGRTSLLLTVAARMRPSAGELRVCGFTLTGRRAALSRARTKVRARTAIARAGGAAELEPELRVRDHVRERGLTLRGAARRSSADAYATACELIGLDLPGKELTGELTATDTTKLALALALMERPAVILLDDLDQGADLAAQRDLWQTLRRASDTGITVLAVTTDPQPATGLADALVTLGRPPTPPNTTPEEPTNKHATPRTPEPTLGEPPAARDTTPTEPSDARDTTRTHEATPAGPTDTRDATPARDAASRGPSDARDATRTREAAPAGPSDTLDASPGESSDARD